MSRTLSTKKGLKYGLFGIYIGKVGNIVFCENGNIRISKMSTNKRKKKIYETN